MGEEPGGGVLLTFDDQLPVTPSFLRLLIKEGSNMRLNQDRIFKMPVDSDPGIICFNSL